MKYISFQYYKTNIGELILGSYEEKLCMCDWRFRKNRTIVDERIKHYLQTDFVEEDSDVIENARQQLVEYFSKKRKQFSISLLFCGTEFQKSVWNELLKIPYGKTYTYLELSKKIQGTKSVRAVAAANGANALSIFVPCHRVIGSDRELMGYAGGLFAKKKLIEMESEIVQPALF
jgi:methylated-DNA-[protein]-cysteine S-methyltransferase